MKALSDTSIMPYGKFKGKQLQNVPASYLLWLYDEIKNNTDMNSKYLTAYIEDNMQALKIEKGKPR